MSILVLIVTMLTVSVSVSAQCVALTAINMAKLPNLRVDSKLLQSSWVIQSQTFDNTTCEVKESQGILTGGTHKVVRFSVSTPNYGPGHVSIGDPYQCQSINLFEYSDCHKHNHFRHYSRYTLRGPVTQNSVIATKISAKRGFCMIDVGKAPGYKGARYKSQYPYCSFQGITAGYTDIYDRTLSGQLFNIDGLVGGTYTIEIEVNPRYCRVNSTCGADTACAAQPQCASVSLNVANCNPNVTCCDGQRAIEMANGIAYCHMLVESNYADNFGSTNITIPVDLAVQLSTQRSIGPGTKSASLPVYNKLLHDTMVADTSGQIKKKKK